MVSAKEIPPGGEGNIEVTFKTQRRKGVNRKKITVTSNDPGNPRLQLEIVADLEQLLDASPRRQWYGRVKQEEVISKVFTLEGKEVSNVKLTNLHLKTDKLKNAFNWKVNDEMTGEGRKVTIEVQMDASAIPPGRFDAVLIAETGIKESAELEMHLSGEVLGPITINPRRLYFGQYQMNEEMVKTITLTANNEMPFRILDINSAEAEFKIDPWKGDSAIEHTITVRITPRLDRDRIRSTLEIKTDMKKQKDISVDIHAYKKRSRPGPNPNAKEMPSTSMKKAIPMEEMKKMREMKEKEPPQTGIGNRKNIKK